jgi:hypothetical protein
MICTSGWIECHPGTAAWVQAFGAIVAVVAAFLVTYLQGRSAFKLGRQDRARAVRGSRAIIRSAQMTLEEMNVDLRQRPMHAGAIFPDARLRADSQHACDTVLAIDLGTLPSEQAVINVVKAQAAVKRGYVFIQPSRPQFVQADLIPMQAFVAELHDACEALEREARIIESGTTR